MELSEKKVLVVKLCCIGDIIQLTPALRALKARQNRVHLVCVPWVKDVAAMVPFLDKIHIAEMKSPFGIIKTILELRKEKFDLVINYHRDLKSFVFVSMLGARNKAGFDWGLAGALVDSRFEFDPKIHETQRYLSVTRGLHVPDSGVYTELKPPARAGIEFEIDGKKRSVGIFPAGGNNPGTVMAAKRWPAQNFNELIKAFEKDGLAVYVFGADFDAPVIEEAVIGTTAKVLISGLNDFSYYASKMDLFIACDTGPLHLVAALGVKTIGLYGPTSPDIFGARGRHSLNMWEKQSCAPCYEPATVLKREFLRCGDNVCMKKITVELVYKAAKAVIQ